MKLQRRLAFKTKSRIKNPDIIVEEKDPRYDQSNWNSKQIQGTFYRLIPNTAAEVFYLQNLEKGRDTFAPAKGDGIIVRVEAIDIVANNA